MLLYFLVFLKKKTVCVLVFPLQFFFASYLCIADAILFCALITNVAITHLWSLPNVDHVVGLCIFTVSQVSSFDQYVIILVLHLLCLRAAQ